MFNRHFDVLDEVTEIFSETVDHDNFPCEDLPRVTEWTQNNIKRFLNDKALAVTHINVSAYGASLVAIGANGHAITPFYNYLKPCPEEIREMFHRHYVDETFLADTASPWLGLLNSGIQAYWLKHCKPNEFKAISLFLHLPQYFSFLMTGHAVSEKTSIGCHTMLWDFPNDQYHSWVRKENLESMFPPIVPVNSRRGYTLHGQQVTIGAGVHDSSAALMPYLVTRTQPFLMLSTGTWNICFNPWNHDPLTKEELSKDCLSYMTYEGKPVKASRIFLGHEHEIQQRELAQYFNIDKDFYKTVRFDERIYHQTKQDCRGRFHPIGMEGTGPLPEKQLQKTDYTLFTDFPTAQHQLMIDLVSWQKLALNLTDPKGHVNDVIVVGGFAKSLMFLETLKREIPERSFYVSDHPRASALGAAWLVQDPEDLKGSIHLLNINSI